MWTQTELFGAIMRNSRLTSFPVLVQQRNSASRSINEKLTAEKQPQQKQVMASPSPHFLVFPFMSKGHTIPLLHLSHLLLRRNVCVTLLTTPLNSPFIGQYLADTAATIITIPFPENVQEIPDGIESTDKLPSMSLFVPFANATKLMKNDFDRALENLPRVSCLISDGFLGWTQYSADRLGIPRLVFYGMNNFAMVISAVVRKDGLLEGVKSEEELFTVPDFTCVKLCKNDCEYPLNDPNATGPHVDFINESVVANMQSKGFVVNSFYELEAEFVDYWNNMNTNNGASLPKFYCVGPLCLAEPKKAAAVAVPKWMEWLDEQSRTTAGRQAVLYVAFGSQAQISSEQYKEIAEGLERSGVRFLWVVRSKELFDDGGFEERVKDRGLVVREWVDQMQILSHESVGGFLSHCGWNSVMESLSVSVPILAWPMMAEQHLNARLVVEVLGVGIRIVVRGFVGWECIESRLRELMEGDKGEQVRKRVREIGELAKKAVEEHGSSTHTLHNLIQQICI